MVDEIDRAELDAEEAGQAPVIFHENIRDFIRGFEKL